MRTGLAFYCLLAEDVDWQVLRDGRFATLEEVIDHYNSDFELSETLDPNLAKHPKGLGLSEEDKAALVAFLKTLTDTNKLGKEDESTGGSRGSRE